MKSFLGGGGVGMDDGGGKTSHRFLGMGLHKPRNSCVAFP